MARPWFIVLVMLLVSSPNAHAILPNGTTLQWEAPEHCPDQAFVEAELKSALEAGSTWRPGLNVVGRITEIPGGYRMTLQAREGDLVRERVLDDASCTVLAEAVRVIIPLPIKPTPPPVRAPSRDPRRESLQAGVVGDLGSLPAPALGLHVDWSLRWPAGTSVLVGGVFLFPTRGYSGSETRVGAEFLLAAGTLAGCRVIHEDWVVLQGCVGLETGQLSAKAVGADTSPWWHRELWVAPRTDWGGELGLGRAFLSASVGVTVPLVRNTYFIETSRFSHTPYWATARVQVGAGYGF